MSLDIRKQCAVCAWRENCNKKHTLKESALHCPDFCRDKNLPEDEAGAPVVERHKQVEDVFGSR
jgi:hypothetical protein